VETFELDIVAFKQWLGCDEPQGKSELFEYSRVFGRLVDRRLLRRVFQDLPFTDGTWSHPANDRTKALWIDGDGWSVVVMPLRDKDMPVFPPAPATEHAA
jgi:hypothetical protein